MGVDKLFNLYQKYRNNLTNSKPSRFLADVNYKENTCIMYDAFEIENPWVDKLDANDDLKKVTKRIVTDINNGKY